jgi:hypothetical protein
MPSITTFLTIGHNKKLEKKTIIHQWYLLKRKEVKTQFTPTVENI